MFRKFMEEDLQVPQPQQLEKFDEIVFSQLENSQVISELNNTFDCNVSEKSNPSRRRTKAERMRQRSRGELIGYNTIKNGKQVRNRAKNNTISDSKSKNGVGKRTSIGHQDFSKTMKVDKKNNKIFNASFKGKESSSKNSHNHRITKGRENKSIVSKKFQNKNIRYNKNKVAKAEKNRKNHIAYLTRNKVKKNLIVAFAQRVAAKKIQKYYREYLEEKQQREKIRFEQAQKR